MGRKAKSLDSSSSTEGKDVVLGVRIPGDLALKLDKLTEERKTNRSIEVNRALEFLVNAISCPRCNTLNQYDSFQCSVCGYPLPKYQKIIDELIISAQKYLDMFEWLNVCASACSEKYDKLTWLISKESDTIQTEINKVISPYVDEYTSYMALVNTLNQVEKRIKSGKYTATHRKTIEYPSYLDSENDGDAMSIISSVISIYELSDINKNKLYDEIRLAGSSHSGIEYHKFQKLYAEFEIHSLHLEVVNNSLRMADILLNTIETLIDNKLSEIRG